jgi:hypothetical protein
LRLTSLLNLPAPGRRQSLYVVLTTLQRPVFLLNSRLGRLSAASSSYGREGFHLPEAHLLPKLRCNFAEFLPEGSLTRLWILSSPTCVGLRYGHLANSLRGFSWRHGLNQLPLVQGLRALSALGVKVRRICLPDPPTAFDQHIHRLADLSFRVTPSLITLARWYRNINLFSIDYAFRPHLRTRLTLGGRTFPRKP